MRKNNSFILYVIFFPVCWKKAIVINTIGCQWHGHGTEIKGIDTVYLEPVPWLLKGSKDYYFKKEKINLIFKCYEWPLKYKWHTRIILERLKLLPKINRTSCTCMSINIGLAFKKLNRELHVYYWWWGLTGIKLWHLSCDHTGSAICV